MTTILNQHEDYQQAQEAYGFPLIIKQLLNRAKIASKDQTISYADKVTYTYAEFFKRVNRLANVLKDMGLLLWIGTVIVTLKRTLLCLCLE